MPRNPGYDTYTGRWCNFCGHREEDHPWFSLTPNDPAKNACQVCTCKAFFIPGEERSKEEEEVSTETIKEAQLLAMVTELQAQLAEVRREVVEYDALRYGEAAKVSALSKHRSLLIAALNRAGDRLAQVQPAVTESWAYDIVPRAEQEIADAISEVEEEKT